MSLHAYLRHGLIAAAVLALAACTELRPSQPTPLLDYQPESFGASAFARHYAARPARTCEAARRALLSHGYAMTSTTAVQVTARKFFQPDAEHHVQLEFKVVCAPEAGNDTASMAFVSGLKEQYVMRKVKNSATVGVGGIGSLSLPVEGSLDALVKVASETVVDRALYERFFALVEEHLERAVEPPPDAPAPPPPPAPAPPPQPVIVLVPSPAPAPQPAASAPETTVPPPRELPASSAEPAAQPPAPTAPTAPAITPPQPAASDAGA